MFICFGKHRHILPLLSCHQNEKKLLLHLLHLVQNKSEARHHFGHQHLLPWKVLLIVVQVKSARQVVLKTESLLCEQVPVVAMAIVLKICQHKALVLTLLTLQKPKTQLIQLISLIVLVIQFHQFHLKKVLEQSQGQNKRIQLQYVILVKQGLIFC